METKTLTVGFVGAGAVNFGRPAVSWDHATRLEKIGNIAVIAIVDVNRQAAEKTLQRRISSTEHGHIYRNCKIFENLDGLIALKPDVVFIGVPPYYRGDMELRCVKAGINVFVEKPLSVKPVAEFLPYAKAINAACAENKVIVSVGYMFRYHAAVLKMKDLIKQHDGKVMSFNARYFFAYTEAINKYWFNEEFSGGPIIEQATHFCDLARFIVGDIDLESINTIMLKDSDTGGAGHLSHIPVEAENDIPSVKRIPRVTLSQWRFKDGGIGTLNHSVALPGSRYEANIDVQMDCLKMSLIEPYEDHCILRVRRLDNEDPNEDHDFTFAGSDPYLSELDTFLKAVRTQNQSLVQSSYTDAVETYRFTRAIVQKGMKQ